MRWIVMRWIVMAGLLAGCAMMDSRAPDQAESTTVAAPTEASGALGWGDDGELEGGELQDLPANDPAPPPESPAPVTGSYREYRFDGYVDADNKPDSGVTRSAPGDGKDGTVADSLVARNGILAQLGESAQDESGLDGLSLDQAGFGRGGGGAAVVSKMAVGKAAARQAAPSKGPRARKKGKEESKNDFWGLRAGNAEDQRAQKPRDPSFANGDMAQPEPALKSEDVSEEEEVPREQEVAAERFAVEKVAEDKEWDRDADDDGRFETERRRAELDENRAPATFLPRAFYFENTYLGGNAAYLEQLRRMDEALSQVGSPHRMAVPTAQHFDPPAHAGVGVHASLDRRSLSGPGRVYLQVAIRGSERFGWRRPPLEVALVVDGVDREQSVAAVRALLSRLGARDRLAVYEVGATEPVARLSGIREHKTALIPILQERLRGPGGAGIGDLAAALDAAGAALDGARDRRSTAPGTQTVMLLVGGEDAARVEVARARAHAMAVRGIVTSVLEAEAVHDHGSNAVWWPVATAGAGNYHRVSGSMEEVVDAELESLARVVARLLRLDIRLAPGVHAVRVLGAQVLDQQQVRRVKAREEATDRHLSHAMGIQSDRGDDGTGIQTVIPYFYGGDSHVVMLELWAERPGAIADVSLKFKDMVRLDNGQARTSVSVRNVPRPDTRAQAQVTHNLSAFSLAEALEQAARSVEAGHTGAALAVLRRARQEARDADAALLSAFEASIHRVAGARLAQALRLAARTKIGGSS